MMVGFENKLACEGIVGDGCGGGRIFYIDTQILYAHDPITNENIKLLQQIKDAKAISKEACIITIECETTTIKFDLSKMLMIV